MGKFYRVFDQSILLRSMGQNVTHTMKQYLHGRFEGGIFVRNSTLK
jgi:hypothetical protein